MITVVCKHFDAGAEKLVPGMIVDSSNWRNEPLMLEQRRIRLATDAEKEEFLTRPTKETKKLKREQAAA